MVFDSLVPGQPIRVLGNVWGGGNTTIAADATICGSFGVCPAINPGTRVFTYSGSAVEIIH